MDEKTRLRLELRQRRREHVASLDDQVRALVFARPPEALVTALPPGATVGLYHARPAEAPTQGYARWLYEHGWPLALPWFADAAAPMAFRRWASPYDAAALSPGPWHAPQPGEDAPEVIPEVIIVPLVGFTDAGERLGQGGGHYDRWLAAHPQAMAVGLAWDCQRVASLPTEPHDRNLAMVITEARVFGRLSAG